MELLQDFGIRLWAALAPLLATAAAGLVVYGISYLVALAKAKAKDVQNIYLRGVIEQAIQAAEQVFESGQGQAKYAYAQEILKSRGINVDRAAIEAEVYWLSKYEKAKAPAEIPPLEAA